MNAQTGFASGAYAQGQAHAAKGRHGAAIAAFEQALAADPNDVKVLFALGNTARALDMAQAAENFYARVLALEPGRIEALVNLANLLRAQARFAEAEALLRPALAVAPDSAELRLTLGSVLRESGNAGDAESAYREALARKPDYPAALANLADLAADRGETAAALQLYDRALKRDPGNAQARLNRAVLHLLMGNLKDGWRDYAARLKVAGKVPVPDHTLKRWSGEKLKRTRLLVSAEQGVGDQIMFASAVPDLCARAKADGGSLILECEPRLVSLFARSFPEATVKPAALETRGGAIHARYDWLKAAGGANAYIEMGSLPKILRSRLEQFPNPNAYLVPDTDEEARWRGTFDNAGAGPFIGLCWRSGKSGGGRARQHAPLPAWAAFLREMKGMAVCVQYDAKDDEIRALEAMSGKTIFVPQDIDQKNELDRSCALFCALDGVVSAPTAVSWLAAGVGTPTIKMLYDSSWTAFGARFEPFAPACLLAAPDKAGDWDDAFAKATKTIARLSANPRARPSAPP